MQKQFDAGRYDTDKADNVHYLQQYEQYFAPFAEREIKLLELGVLRGGSLQLWRDFFPQGTIVGLDINPCPQEDSSGRIRLYQGRQDDTGLLDCIVREVAPDGFDIIIDDCSHIGALTRASFWHLYPRCLKAGGLYAIEDWGTGYWDSWTDGRRYRPEKTEKAFSPMRWAARVAERLPLGAAGHRLAAHMDRLAYRKQRLKSHDYGLVGFIKQLVDEAGMGDITHPRMGVAPHRLSSIKKLQISHGLVLVFKP